MKNPIRTLPAILLALFAAGAVHAAPTTLAALLNGGSITAGDKLFDNWSLVNYQASGLARSFNAANIEVTALADGGQGPGLRFNANNGELNVVGNGVLAYIDLMFGFSVTALDPSMRITGSSLQYTPGGAYWSVTLDGSYNAGSYIRENVDTTAILSNTAALGDLGSMEVEHSTLDLGLGAGQTSTSDIVDSATFAQQNRIWVTKNVHVWSADTTDSAGISSFDQRFSQLQIPEPATLALVAMALAGLLAPSAQRCRRDTEA